MSPEMVETQTSGPASDLWALGIVLYMMYTQVSPFDGGNEEEIFEKIKNSEPTYPSIIPE